MKDILAAVTASIPRYNDYLLRTFMAEQIAGAAGFIDTMFGEAVKLFDGHITYLGHRVMTPERRAEYELRPRSSYRAKQQGGCRVTTSDLLLVEYVFAYNDVEYPVPLYIPYLRNDVVVIEDTTYVLQRSIKERAFSRINNGITMKVIRQPIPFYNRPAMYRLDSLTDDWFSNELVPTTRIHRDKRNRDRKLPNESIMHYLLCKFGFIGTLARFGLTPDDCGFVTMIGNDCETYRYFAAKFVKRKQPVDLYLKVKKEKLNDRLVVKVIASILYTLTGFTKHQVNDLYDPSGAVFRLMLGKIINGSGANEPQLIKKVDTHIVSVDTYLDPITRERLHSYGIEVGDIYDLLQFVFCKIDELVQVSHTDMYSSRIDYLEELLVETIVRSVYSRWYDARRRLGGADIDPRKLADGKELRRILMLPDNLIARLYESRIVQKSPPAYGDNALVGWLIQKMRQSGQSKSRKVIRSPDHRFDPSMLAVESVIAFSKSNPGAAGAINPYLEITPSGSIVRPDYADEIDAIREYLP